MSFRFSVLASGSKANCTYVEAGQHRFLIDCGLSARQIEVRLGLLDVNPSSLQAILISHEHSDHICGASVFSRRFKIPVYANSKTSKFLKGCYAIEEFTTGQNFGLGLVDLHPFRITHDAVDPVGFAVEAEGLKLTYATDIGKVNGLLLEAVRQANAVILEANHDRELLMTCDYPWELKQRIASSHGHLENSEAGRCMQEAFSSELNCLVLAHLSENSNRPAVAKAAVQAALADYDFTAIHCADPYCPTQLFDLSDHNLAFKMAV